MKRRIIFRPDGYRGRRTSAGLSFVLAMGCLVAGHQRGALAAPASASPAPAGPGKPVAQLLVNGKVYEEGTVIEVAADRPTRIRARVMDGHRYVGLNPGHLTKAAGGRVTMLRSGEWGYTYTGSGVTMEIVVGRERAELTPSAGLSLSRVGDLEAEIRLRDPSQTTLLTVEVELTWRITITQIERKVSYTQNPPPVRVVGRFQVKGVGAAPPPAWFQTKNLRATGQKSARVERILQGLQAEMDGLEKILATRSSYDENLRGASLAVGRIKARLGDLETALAADRQASPPVVTEVVITGLSTDPVTTLLGQQERRAERLRELWTYCQGKKAEATQRLLQMRQSFAANVVRATFKSYLVWMNAFFSATDILSVPTGFADLITILYPSRLASALDKPRLLLETWTAAIDDSSTLLDQKRAIELLARAEQFFQERMDAVVKERGPLLEGIQKMRPLVERVEAELKAALAELRLARFTNL